MHSMIDFSQPAHLENRLSNRRQRGAQIERIKQGERISAARLAASKASATFQTIQHQIDDANRRRVRVPKHLELKLVAAFEVMNNANDELDAALM